MENNIIEQEITQQTNNVPEEEKTSIMRDKNTETVGYGTFLGLILLFSIPIIGWIACAICMFAPKRKNLKNYARAYMTRLVLRCAVVVLIVSLIINLLSGLILPYINDSLGTQFNDMGEIVEIVSDIITGNYTGVIERFKPQLIEALGEEIEPVLNEVSKDEYNDLITQIINGEYEQALSDFMAGKYTALQDALGVEEYNELMKEFEAAAKGEPSVFDELREIIPFLNFQSVVNSEGIGAFSESESVIVQHPQNGAEVVVVS